MNSIVCAQGVIPPKIRVDLVWDRPLVLVESNSYVVFTLWLVSDLIIRTCCETTGCERFWTV